MKLNVLMVALACGLLSIEMATSLQAQDSRREVATTTPSGQTQYFAPTYSTGISGGVQWSPQWQQPAQNQRQSEINAELRAAMSELKDSESESDRSDAIKKLRGALGEQYDESLDNYETYLKTLEERIKEMKAQIEKRRDAKMDLVDLRVQTLVNEADGMGWPDRNGQPRVVTPFGSGQQQYFDVPAVDPFSEAAPRLVVPSQSRREK